MRYKIFTFFTIHMQSESEGIELLGSEACEMVR